MPVTTRGQARRYDRNLRNVITNTAIGTLGAAAARGVYNYLNTPRGGTTSSPVVARQTPSSSAFRGGRNIAAQMRAAVRSSKRLSRKGAAASKSKGFLGKRRVSRRVKQTSRRNYKGVSLVIELGGVVDSAVNNGSVNPQSKTHGNTIAVGHMTMPSETAIKMACRAVIKQLFIRTGDGDLSNFELQLPEANPQDFVRITYYTNPDSDTEFNQDFPCIVGGVTQSYEQIAVAFADWCTSNATLEYVYKSIAYVPAGTVTGEYNMRPYTRLNLSGCMLRFYSKSTLKLQNRTVNTASGDEESVDNVPIYGRGFEGKGSGTGAITKDLRGMVSAARDFVGDDKYGAIAKVPREKWYQEVPRADQFLKVKNSIKAHLDPGEVKTSRLLDRLTISFDRLLYTINVYNYLNVNRQHGLHPLGSYRFFMFEKMLNAVEGTLVNSMKVAFETNLFISCTATIKRNYQTAQLNDVYNFAAES